MNWTATKYTSEKKEHVLSQMSAQPNKPVAVVAQLTSVPEASLYLWRRRNVSKAAPCPAMDKIPSNEVPPTSWQ